MSIEVKVNGDNIQQAIRVLSKKVEKDGILSEYKRRAYYEKPSDVKRRKKRKSIAKWKKQQQKLEKGLTLDP